MSENRFLVFNRQEWILHDWWTEDEIDAADEKGFIGMKHGVDCYLARHLKTSNTLQGPSEGDR